MASLLTILPSAWPLIWGITTFIIAPMSLGLVAPTLLMRLGRHWVEARYLYPAAALWIPLLVGSLEWWRRSGDEAGTKVRRRLHPAAVLVLVVWYLGAAAGSFYMQHQAMESSRHVPEWAVPPAPEPGGGSG